MLILIKATTRQKMYFLLRLFIITALFTLIIVQLSGLFKGYTYSSGNWLKEDNPTGNSLRVEEDKKSIPESQLNKQKTEQLQKNINH